jgi:hypothetical protein
MTDILGRPRRRVPRADAVRAASRRERSETILADLEAPPPLLLLPLRLEYRVVDTDVPVRVSGNVRELLRNDPAISIDAPEHPALGGVERPAHADARSWRLDAATVRFNTQRQIWFRWFPDDDFALRGIAPPTEQELAAIARFDSACAGKPWHAVDDASVVSAWTALAREMEPERALHLIRHRGDSGDPNHLDALGKMVLLPEKVALFGLNADGFPTLLGEGTAIDAELRYSFAALQAGGWLTDFDVALKAGMGLRLTDANAVASALSATWIVAVGISKNDGAAALSTLIDDAVANGTFAFLPQDTPTNNTPGAPTPYRRPRADLVGFLRTAADAEKGVLASPLAQSAEIFAEALGLDITSVATAPGSGDLAFEDARAMVRVIGPALIDTAFENTAALSGIDEHEVIDLFAEAAVARGPLPPVRFGKNPYGVLPVVKLGDLTSLASDTDNRNRIEEFVRNFALIVNNQSQSAAANVPVIEPGDPDAVDKLEAVLKLNPVSRRLEVLAVMVEDYTVRALGCAYVTSEAHPVATYLGDLARRPIGDLPDPTFEDGSFPLLYRLARLSLGKATLLTAVTADFTTQATLNTRVHLTEPEARQVDLRARTIASASLASLAARGPVGISATAADAVRFASGRFLEGLRRLEAIALEPDGVARLETLLMETIDLFQHRIDAWATGIAYRRLIKRRRAGGKGLVGGYWGLLGRLRPTSITGRTDGYLQAPSPHQAATAAVLRSAHLRHSGSGAFAIGLDSARVRRGMKLLEMLQAGLSPSEALGYLAERNLHDRHQDILTFRLRDLFPLRDPRDDAALEVRLSDGLAFLAADIAALVSPAEVPPLRALQDELRKDFDALADIVVAEATHLRAMGQADAANAWLQVMSGETIPGRPSVLRTRRNGHGSSHRVVVLIDPAEAQPGDAPRAIAEPALAALADARLDGFDSAFVSVAVRGANGDAPTLRELTLVGDLGLAPIDLLVGGESEVVLRARHRLVLLWQTDDALRSVLGSLPDRNIISYINQTRPVTVDLDVGGTTVRSLVNAAAELRRSVAQGRMLEPSDFAAAADPSTPLTDEVERDLLVRSSAVLTLRATNLANRLGADLAALRTAIGPSVAAARNHRRLVDDRADAATLALAMGELESLRRALDVALVRASHYAEPAALRLIATSEIAADPDDFDRGLASLAERLSDKAARLASVLVTGVPPATATAARSQRNALVAALKATLDGDALLTLPPLERLPATTPLLQANPPAAAGALGEWSLVRAKVARIAALFGDDPWRAHATAAAATGADDPEVDARSDEGIAPRARLFGTFVSANDPSAAETFTGFTADEWAEQRPSRLQQTGLAINYDSPQSEPPNALLLCEPAGPRSPPWSLQGAAQMVAETIALMKTRALSAQARPLPGPLLPFANQVPFKQFLPSGSSPRIPVRDLNFVSTTEVAADSTLVVAASATHVGVGGAGLAEITGFSQVKE